MILKYSFISSYSNRFIIVESFYRVYYYLISRRITLSMLVYIYMTVLWAGGL